jgi:TolB protein
VKSVTRITDFKGQKEFGRFDVNPDGEKLLIPIIESVGNDAFAQIWTLGTNGMGLTKVTTGKYKDLDPVYSPDAKHIYFSSNRGEERPKIWRVFATGTGGLTRVTSSSTSDRTPCIAPSGQNLAYTALMAGTSEWQIWTVNANGALPTQLIVGVNPVYSPDGKKILYTRDNPDTKKEDIWTMHADGSSRTQMTSGDSNCTSPRWSPDGAKIVFASDKGLDEEKKHNFDIWLMNADGTNVTQLTTNGSYDDFPVFDPNGKYIYFRSNRGGSWDIWRMELAIESLQ